MSDKMSQHDAAQVLRRAFNDNNNSLEFIDSSSLVPAEYDELVLSYTSGDLTGVVYKSASATVATLTLTYDAPGGNLIGVVRT